MTNLRFVASDYLSKINKQLFRIVMQTLLASFLFSSSAMASLSCLWKFHGGIRTVSTISTNTNMTPGPHFHPHDHSGAGVTTKPALLAKRPGVSTFRTFLAFHISEERVQSVSVNSVDEDSAEKS